MGNSDQLDELTIRENAGEIPRVDSSANLPDAPSWCNMVVGHAMLGERLDRCVDAFGKLKAATNRLARAKNEMANFQALGPSAMPMSEEMRMQNIMSASDEIDLMNKIRSHAERDARFKKVDDEMTAAQREFDTCSATFKSAYDALVRHFAE